MNKKLAVGIIIALVALFMLTVGFMSASPETDHSGERMSFNVSEGSTNLSSFINTVKTKDNYKGYDKETVKWMESLGDKRVFVGNDTIAIMNISDAEKLPKDPGITDVFIYDQFTGEVIENHDLGSKYPTVYYVKDIDNINQEIVSNGLA